MSQVFDSSAILAAVFAEPGGQAAAALWAQGDNLVCSVNYAEVVGKLNECGMSNAEVVTVMEGVPLTVVDFDQATAQACGLLRLATKSLGLSLGDRACIALAQSRGATVVTADKLWAKVPGLDVHWVR